MPHRLSRISAAPYSTKQYEEPWCQTIGMENGYDMHASVCMGITFLDDNAYI